MKNVCESEKYIMKEVFDPDSQSGERVSRQSIEQTRHAVLGTNLVTAAPGLRTSSVSVSCERSTKK